MKLLISPEAIRDLKGIDRKLAERILAKMEQVAAAPFAPHPQARPLKGSGHQFRLRVGDWRVLYVVDRRTDSVEIVRVKSRQEAYRK